MLKDTAMWKQSLCLLLAVSGLFATNRVAAQDATESKLRFGAYVAPTLSWMRPTTSKSNDRVFTSENAGSEVGFTYGLMAAYHFSENYAFVTGLQVNMTGGKLYTVRDGGYTAAPASVNSADFDYNLQYVELPLALKLSTDDLSGLRVFGQAGITTGVNIGKKANYTVAYTDEAGTAQSVTEAREKVSGTFAIAPVMFSMSLGAGLSYQVSHKMSGYLAVFFNNGFAPDATNPDDYKIPTYQGNFKDGNIRLNNLALRLGMFF